MSIRIVRNLCSGLAAQAWTALLGVLALPVIVRGLGAERYGLLALSLTVIGFASVADLGVGRAASKFIAEDFESGEVKRTERFARTSLTLSTAAGLAGTGLFLVLAPLLAGSVFAIRGEMRKEAAFVFSLTAAGLFPVLLRILFDGILAGHHRIASLNLTNMLANTFKIGLSLIAVRVGYGILAIVAVNVTACWLHALGLGWYTRRLFCGRIRLGFGWDKQIARQLLALGVVSTLSWVLANVIFLYADRIIIGMFLPLVMVGYYTAAFDIASKQWYLSSAVAQTFFPVFSGQSVGGEAALRSSYLQAAKLLAILVTGAGMLLVVFARELLLLWISPEFSAHSSGPLMVLSVGILFSCYVTIPYTAIISGSGRPGVCVPIFAAAVILHAGASVWWLRYWGVLGVALAFTLAYALVFAVMSWWASRRVIRIGMSRLLAQCFLVPWVVAGGCGSICWFVLRPLIHSLGALGCAVAFVYAIFLTICSVAAYSREERRWGWSTGVSVISAMLDGSKSAALAGRTG